eukprot:1706738-Pyramimonas_sp.AAC.1
MQRWIGQRKCGAGWQQRADAPLRKAEAQRTPHCSNRAKRGAGWQQGADAPLRKAGGAQNAALQQPGQVWR